MTVTRAGSQETYPSIWHTRLTPANPRESEHVGADECTSLQAWMIRQCIYISLVKQEQWHAASFGARSMQPEHLRHGIAVLLVLLLCASLFLVYNGNFNSASRDANETRIRQHEQLRRPTEASVRVAKPHPPVLQGYSGIIDHKEKEEEEEDRKRLSPVSSRRWKDETASVSPSDCFADTRIMQIAT
ncbi:hypothetical protein PAMA_004757 [Pampus argenteus]